MKCLNGNSILIIDSDTKYSEMLTKYLVSLGAQCSHVATIAEAKNLFKNYDFDLILCGYYLSDGIIHQLIDWCKTNLDFLPVFVVLANIQPMDKNLMSHYTISAYLRKKEDPKELLNDLSSLLFDFQKFYQGVWEMVEPRGIKFEVIINNKSAVICGQEILPRGIIINTEGPLEVNGQGLLRITVFDSATIKTSVFSGFISEAFEDGFMFRVYPGYQNSWDKFLEQMLKKQFNINSFMKKASGT
jgi:CheY-like chemotaxis protein